MHAADAPALFRLLSCAARGEPLEIYGAAAAAPCYVGDVVEGFTRLLARCGAFARRIDFAGPIVSAEELAGKAREVASRGLTIEKRAAPREVLDRPRPQPARARELLGWLPQTPLALGLQRTLASFGHGGDLPEARPATHSAAAAV
jgi:UDP-glucuronate decarboxylase